MDAEGATWTDDRSSEPRRRGWRPSPTVRRSTRRDSRTTARERETASPDASTPEITLRHPTPERSTDLVGKFDPERTDASLTVGDEGAGSGTSRSHGLIRWNDAAERRAVSIRVTDRRDGVAVVDDTFEFSADGSVSISFVEPSEYVVDLRVPATESAASVTIDPGLIDCNASNTYVRIAADGTLTSTTMSTMMGCSSDRDGT